MSNDYLYVAPGGGGGGTVTAIGMTVPTGLVVFPSSITTSGTFAITLDTGYVIPTQALLDSFAVQTRGTGQTIGATTDDVITFALGATPGTYVFDLQVSAFESGTPSGAGFQIFGSVRTTGAAGVLIELPDVIKNTETAITDCDATIVVSGNDAIVRVTGVAGLTINWKAEFTNTMVS